MFSLLGVVLIARPQFLFGRPSHFAGVNPVVERAQTGLDVSEKGTPAERLGAVGYGAVTIALYVALLWF